MLITPKDFFNFISPARGSRGHILDAQQIFAEWVDGWIGILPVVLSSICLLLKYPANHGILASDKRSRGGRVSRQQVQKAIKQKSSQDWVPGSASRLPQSSFQRPTAASILSSGMSPEEIICTEDDLCIKSTFCNKIGE